MLETKESAVSEVIGIVLIVALTVIMAAIIASNTLGMMERIPKTSIVIVTVDLTPDHSQLFLTYRGGPDQASLNSLTIHWPDGTEDQWLSPKVGDKTQLKNMTPDINRVVVIGHFQNNNLDHIVLDTFVK